ncbi:MAG TPA: DUF2059 domain-containing protein [Blastocatellia bacterium]|nr:DUF2059 domain-containing protein [Blastocatellia bacterium]
MSMYRRLGIVSFLAVLILSVTSQAQESLTPEKRALIKELMTVTNVSANTQSIMDTMLGQMGKIMPDMIRSRLPKESEEGGSAEDQEQRQELAAQVAERVMKRFRELFPERVNMPGVVEQIYYALYDKYFSEQEIKDLITFYKTPTGQKSIQVLPQLFSESLQRTSEMIEPKVIQMTRDIIQEQIEEVRKAKEK